VKYGTNALDFESAINVSRDDNGNWTVGGTDLGNTAGAFHWSETKAFASDEVDDDYAALLSKLVWHTNVAAFRGWAIGEVLFIGARGNKRGDGSWEITFNYAVLENKGLFSVGDVEITAAYPAGMIGTTAENLKAAAMGENEEWTKLYPEFAEVAAQEGFKRIASAFKLISKIEADHEARFLKLLGNLVEGTAFLRDEKIHWFCRKCGHVHFGEKALDKCPVCGHPQGYFEEKAKNF